MTGAGRPPALWRRLVVRPRPLPTGLPMWLVGDWNRVVRDSLDLLRAVPLIGALATVIVGSPPIRSSSSAPSWSCSRRACSTSSGRSTSSSSSA
jgi:hypothetical protein